MKNTPFGCTVRPDLRRLKAAVLAVFISLMILPAMALADEVGYFSRIEGKADVLRPGAPRAVEARVNDKVSIGDIVRTKGNSKAEITFNDQTTISLAPETRLKIDEYVFKPDNSREKGAVSLLRGKVRGIISGAKRKAVPVASAAGASTFDIKTPTAIAGVRGTDLIVFYIKGVSGIIFREGHGFAYNPKLPESIINVTAGQATFVIHPEAMPLPPKAVSSVELTRHIKDTSIEAKKEDESTGGGSTAEGAAAASGETRSGENGKESGSSGQTNGGEAEIGEGGHGSLYASLTGLTTTETSAGASETAETTATESSDLQPVTETAPETLGVPPAVTITGAPPKVTNSSSASFTLSSNEEATYSYSLDGQTLPVPSEDTLNLTGLSEGVHTLTVTATDPDGMSSTASYTWLCGRNYYTLSGLSTITGSTGAVAVSGALATTSDNSAGWWYLTAGDAGSAPPPSSWNEMQGGTSSNGSGTSGYWLENAYGTYDGSAINGYTSLVHLSRTALGTGSGYVAGSYDASTGVWQYTDGSEGYGETALKYVNRTGATGIADALMGGTSSIWATTSSSKAYTYVIGSYSSSNVGQTWVDNSVYSFNFSNTTNTTYDGGAYKGFFAVEEAGGSMRGGLYALYVDPSGRAGIIKGTLTGSSYADIGMFGMSGGLMQVQLPKTSGDTASTLYSNVYVNTYQAAGNTTLTFDSYPMGTSSGRPYSYTANVMGLTGNDWGIINVETSGSYAGLNPASNWRWSSVYNDGSQVIGFESTGSQWSGDTISGLTRGYGADATTGATWISAGDVLGTFDPSTYTWHSAQIGAWLETSRYIALMQTVEGRTKLIDLNIPFVEVGVATLTGSDGNLSVSINNAGFYAYSNNAPARLWAANSVTGTYSTDPSVGTNVALSGNGISGSFIVQSWSGGNWMSTVTGSGTYAGTGYMNGSAINIKGAAAGAYSAGSLSGTAAGSVSRP